MQIKEYKDLIANLPEKTHSFIIKKSNWENEKKVFEDKETLEISRNDLFNLGRKENVNEFIIKVLMWGYPTGGRGNNIKNLLAQKQINKLEKIIKKYKNNKSVNEEILKDMKDIKGLGLSTLSKFLYFLEVTFNGKMCVILDKRIIDVINKKKFDDLDSLEPITSYNASKKYYDFLEKIDEIAKSENFTVGQLEMFLFIFGTNLKTGSN